MNHIDESTTDGTIDSLLNATRVAWSMGVFDDEFFKYLISDFIMGIRSSMKYELYDIPKENHGIFLKYADILIKPIEQSKDMKSFISALKNVVIAKNNIVKRLQLNEVHIIESSKFKLAFDSFKRLASQPNDIINDWWVRNKNKILKLIVEYLIKYIIGTLSLIKPKLKGS
jgi:hypothetical protein